MADTKPLRAPLGLGRAGKALWRRLQRGYLWREDELKVLEEAARTADLVARLEAEVAVAPLTTTNAAGTPITHPAVVELRLQRSLLAQLLSRIRLPEAQAEVSEWDNLSASERARKAARARWS